MVDDETAGPIHGAAVLVQRLGEGARVVVLDQVSDLGRAQGRVDIDAHRVACRLRLGQHPLADRQDLVAIGLELTKANQLLEALRADAPRGVGTRHDLVAQPGEVLGESGPGRLDGAAEPVAERPVALLGAGCGDDRVEEGGE